MAYTRALVSESLRDKLRVIHSTPERKEQMRKLSKIGILISIEAKVRKGKPLKTGEYANRHDTCKAQLLRRLRYCAEQAGKKNVSSTEVRSIERNLESLLTDNFGSFNEAKRLAGLIVNPKGRKTLFTKQLILEDMVSFHLKFGKWPKRIDYKKAGRRELICSFDPVFKAGGLPKLIPEAEPMLAEKLRLREVAKRLPQIANNIEMEFAGRARV